MDARIKQIANELISDNISTDYQDKLKLIGTDSNYMIAFLSAIEEEFDIEFDDEEICSEFFNDYQYIIKCICKLKKAYD